MAAETLLAEVQMDKVDAEIAVPAARVVRLLVAKGSVIARIE